MTFALNSYSGSALEYDSDFVGRYQGFDVELLSVALSPSLVYKVNENLSASVGITMLYGQLDLKAAIPPLLGAATPDRDGLAKIDDGDDISAAITASLFWKVTNQFQLALTYLGENELEFDGDLSITLPGIGSGTTLGNIAADVEITFPQGLIFSTATDINDQLTMTTQVGWKEWSSLDEVPITTNAAGAAIPLDWDDVWSAGVGMRWKSQGPWTYYAGVSYASDPTNASDRVSILPVDEQWRLASGFTYERNNGNKIGGVITYIDLGDAPIDSTGAAGRYVGEYDTNYAVFLALNYNWK
jgi:long-chain fatty acid transport protein